MTEPKISVIVPLQDHLCFDIQLELLARQQQVSHGEFEVVAVDSLYLRDWPQLITEIRERHPALEVHFEQIGRTNSRARQLNVAVAKARAALLLLLADDFMPCPELVKLHLQAHQHNAGEKIVAMGPGIFPQDSDTNEFMRWLETSGELFGVCFTDPHLKLPDYYFYMANTSLKRAFLHKAGKFDEDFPYDAMDDWEMGLRLAQLGMRNMYLPEAVAIHRHIVSLQERCRAMEYAGESSAIFDAKRGRTGPWGKFLNPGRVPHAQRKRETVKQRYTRLMREHWLRGYNGRRALSRSNTPPRA